MSKTNPDNKTRTTFHPRFSPETQAVRPIWRPTQPLGDNQATGKTGLTASVKRHIWRPLTTVNDHFSTSSEITARTPTLLGFWTENFLFAHTTAPESHAQNHTTNIPSRMQEGGLVTKKPRSMGCGAFWFALESRLSGAGYPRSPAAFRTGGTAAGWTESIPASWRLRPSSWGQPSCRPRRHRRCSRRR